MVIVGPGSLANTATVSSTTNDPGPGVNSASKTVTVNQEDARAYYTGDMLVFTPSAGGNASVLLRATIQDITAVDPTLSPPNPDNYAGDIRKANVTLKADNGSGTSVTCTPTVGLINAADMKTGSASCLVSLPAGSQGSQEFKASIVVSNYYKDTAEGDLGVIEVANPNGSYITGGGYMVESASSGTYAATNTSRTNLGFNVKYNKNGTNPQGHVNIIFRKTIGGVVHVYQIKSNAMDTFGTSLKDSTTSAACAGPPGSTCYGLADFKSKANLTEVTNPTSPVSLGGNLSLQMTLTDKGEPGSTDTMAISLWNGTTLLFSSYWTGTQTTQQLMNGGNLVVH